MRSRISACLLLPSSQISEAVGDRGFSAGQLLRDYCNQLSLLSQSQKALVLFGRPALLHLFPGLEGVYLPGELPQLNVVAIHSLLRKFLGLAVSGALHLR
jgi:hypothetical protein